MEEKFAKDECRIDIATNQDYRSRIHPLVDRIVSQYDKDGRFHHIGPEPIPSRQAIIDIIYKTIPFCSRVSSRTTGLTISMRNITWASR